MQTYKITYKGEEFYTISKEFWSGVAKGCIVPAYDPNKHYVGPNTRPWLVSKVPVELPLTGIKINSCAYQHDHDYAIDCSKLSESEKYFTRLKADKEFYWNIKANIKSSDIGRAKRIMSYALACVYYGIVRTLGKKHFGLPSKIQ